MVFYILKHKRLPLLEVLLLILRRTWLTLLQQFIVTAVHILKVVKFEGRLRLGPVGLLQSLVKLWVERLLLLSLCIIVLVPDDAVLFLHLIEELFNRLFHIFILEKAYV